MKNKIFHKEKIEVSRTVKQWILSMVLLINVLISTLMWHYYRQGTLLTKNFDKESAIAIISILFFFSILILFIVFYFSGYTLTITSKGITLKPKKSKPLIIEVDQILSFKKLSKKEAANLMSEIRNSSKRKKTKIKQFFIGKPNYLFNLKNGDSILVQSKRHNSLEYSMNKILNING